MTAITLAPVRDFAALGARWRALEAEAACSFFQSWTWTGCLAEERFPQPVLLEARQAGQTLALALFHHRRSPPPTLYLGESGDAAHDAPFIEYNGVLLHAAAPAGLEAACLLAARHAAIGRANGSAGRRPWWPRRLVLSGIGDASLAAARAAGRVVALRSSAAPRVELARLRRDGRDFLDSLSANTRYQLRRSDRAYGALAVRRADSAAEAHRFLDELAVLHQATWTARGAAGAFANPFFARFHHALIDRGMARGEIDLLRVTAGGRPVGILYNLRFRGWSLAYQSGFDYAGADRHQKPGLTCHHQGIRFCSALGLAGYDFLAGEDRYKRSLADGKALLHWITLDSRGSPAWWRGVAAGLARSWRARFESSATQACGAGEADGARESGDFTPSRESVAWKSLTL